MALGEKRLKEMGVRVLYGGSHMIRSAAPNPTVRNAPLFFRASVVCGSNSKVGTYF
jgi:hypothetical protein